MLIDGKIIASQIKSELKEKISSLKLKNIIPQLAVILVGNDPGSEAYVRQKEKVGEEIGAMVSVYRFAISESDKDTSGVARRDSPDGGGIKKELIDLVNKLNADKSVHGIIIQRPVPIDISKEELDLLVIPKKDVDGFHPDSSFTPPIASAVSKILEWVYKSAEDTPGESLRATPGVEEFSKDFINWLRKQKILVIGRGETAGKPIAETLQKMKIKITIAHSKTNNLEKLCLSSNIIISCVGRANIVRHDMVLPTTLLIGVGLHQENGKLATDYDQEDIANKVAYFTPVPGGVGPVNVACLFENLIIASK